MRRSFRSADRRLVGAAVVSGLLLVPLGVFGSSALAHGGPSAAQYQYKVTICHHTGSKKHPWHQISISSRAVPAHLRHHDQMPPCPTVLFTQGHDHGHGHDSDRHNDSSTIVTVHGHSGSQGDDEDGDGGGHGHGNGHHGKS